MENSDVSEGNVAGVAVKTETITLSIAQHTDLKFFSLKNHQQIKTPFAFVDESGLLHSKTDPYFGLGLIKTQRPSTLYPKFRSLRTKLNLYPELKFNGMTKHMLPLAKGFFDILFESPVSKFSCIIIPKHDENFDPETYFNNDIFEIYRKFLILLIKESISDIDILTILADDYFCPYDDRSLDSFEGSMRAIINDHFGRIALTGICQIKSNANDFIQLTDLILGCVLLDLKLATGLISRDELSTTKKIQIELLNHLKGKFGLDENKSFFERRGVLVKTFVNKRPAFYLKVFDAKRAVHVIRKSEPSSM